MARAREGSIVERNGKLYARVTFYDANGKRKAKEKQAKDVKDAGRKIEKLYADLDKNGPEAFDFRNRTFADFARSYEQKYVKEAVIHDERKVGGLKSYSRMRYQPGILTDYFGQRKLR